ncbi:MAG: hypothetical protein R3E48_17430 [Burkholderiaceae bacterium]
MATLVEVETDTGIVGWGEAFAQGLEPPEATATAMVGIPRCWRARTRFAIEVLWHRMYHASRDYGRKGSVVAAISAIDTALWDIAEAASRGADPRFCSAARFRHHVEPCTTGFYQSKARAKHNAWPKRPWPTMRPAFAG